MNWKVKTQNYIAQSGDKIVTESPFTQAGVVITLPSNPLIGDEVSVINAIQGSFTVIVPGAKPYIDSSIHPPLTIQMHYEAVTFIYTGILGWTPNRPNVVVSGQQEE